jgi:hypothetical protein
MDDAVESGETNPRDLTTKIKCIVLTVGCIGLLIRFLKIEFDQAKSSGLNYLNDYWNWIESCSLLLNLTFLILLNIDVLANKTIHKVDTIRTIGAIGCWFMWIKVFYWMRLFKATAHFITLIFTTIYDVRIFTLMLLIIIIAFANFFFIMNLNTPMGLGDNSTTYYYMPDYGLGKVMNSLMGAYFISLGEFDYGGYGSGEHFYVVWIFFTLGSFLMLVVFMNMLIAIMGDTFSVVQGIQEENSLKEQT